MEKGTMQFHLFWFWDPLLKLRSFSHLCAWFKAWVKFCKIEMNYFFIAWSRVLVKTWTFPTATRRCPNSEGNVIKAESSKTDLGHRNEAISLISLILIFVWILSVSPLPLWLCKVITDLGTPRADNSFEFTINQLWKRLKFDRRWNNLCSYEYTWLVSHFSATVNSLWRYFPLLYFELL